MLFPEQGVVCVGQCCDGVFMKNPPENMDGDYRALCATRHVYEAAARECVEKINNVDIRTCAAVIGLQWSADNSRVMGEFFLGFR